MKATNNKIILIKFLFTGLTLFMVLAACKKTQPPALKTLSVTEITSNSVKAAGHISSDGGENINSRGFVWNTIPNPSLETNNGLMSAGTGSGTFSSSITGLLPNTQYYLKAYASNSAGTAYGDQVSFTTDSDLPLVATAEITEITLYSAKSGGDVRNDGGSEVTARGLVWSINSNPEIFGKDNKNEPDSSLKSYGYTVDGQGTGSFNSEITGLAPKMTYYARAYATNVNGTAYGQQFIFSTLSGDEPQIETSEIINITQHSATSGGTVISDGDTPVTARGICWSSGSNPTIAGSHTTDGSGTGSFTSYLTGLESNKTYYVRAYATNTAGTVYGNESVFTTLQSITLPEVTTNEIENITQNSATGGGIVTFDGGSEVIVRGIAYSKLPYPTVLSQTVQSEGGMGLFTANMTNLDPGSLYFVRAYAVNPVGIAYGNQVEFTTKPGLSPEVTTLDIANITSTTAKGGGTVVTQGDAPVTARGVCWSTSPDPTTNDSHTNDGEGIGSFVSHLTELIPESTYYVRAYATNIFGTSYGVQLQFTTQEIFVCGINTISDVDGNIYNTIQIGIQCWMAENLKTTKYRNGSPIDYPGTNNAAWANNSTGAYAWYNNDISWKESYGALYNWHAVANPNGLCPEGWHVISVDDWDEMINYLFGAPPWGNIGNKMKSCRQINSPLGGECNTNSHPRWEADNSNYGTDDYGFGMLPGGRREYSTGLYSLVGETGGFWMTPEQNIWSASLRMLGHNHGTLLFGPSWDKRYGFSIRCIKTDIE